jgi:hypothetical protein
VHHARASVAELVRHLVFADRDAYLGDSRVVDVSDTA